jgi:hypothetical protein
MWWMAIASIAGALTGGIAGGISVRQREKEEKATLERQKESAWLQYLYGQQHSDAQFSIQKGEALSQLAVQKKNLDAQLGMSIDDYNTAMLAQAFGIQDARIQTNSAIGESLAAEGMSGTRGNAANETVRAYASQGLERNIDVQDRQNQSQLNKMITGANMTVNAIEHEKASWMPGGHRVRAKEAQDFYNMNIAQLGQSNFDWQIDQATPTFLDYFSVIMSGGQSGANLGNNVNKSIDAWNLFSK